MVLQLTDAASIDHNWEYLPFLPNYGVHHLHLPRIVQRLSSVGVNIDDDAFEQGSEQISGRHGAGSDEGGCLSYIQRWWYCL